MKIQINDHRKIFALQEEFNRFFPNFKIEFLGKPSKVGNPPSEKMVKANKTLGDCRVVHNKGELTPFTVDNNLGVETDPCRIFNFCNGF